jgi:hypothetical protein
MAKKKVAKKKVAKKKVATKKDSTAAVSEKLSVDQLLKKLGATTDPIEKRKLRMRLRKAGHKGGLRKNSKE